MSSYQFEGALAKEPARKPFSLREYLKLWYAFQLQPILCRIGFNPPWELKI